MGLRYRKGIKGGCFFVSTSVAGHIPIFRIDQFCRVIIDSLNYYCGKYGSDLDAFVLMPTHLHLIILMNEKKSLSDFMRDFKKFTSVTIKKLILVSGDHYGIQAKLAPYIPRSDKRSFKLWEDRFDDVAIYSEDVYLTKLNYIRHNPVRAGLVKSPEDYRYSSFYESRP